MVVSGALLESAAGKRGQSVVHAAQVHAVVHLLVHVLLQRPPRRPALRLPHLPAYHDHGSYHWGFDEYAFRGWDTGGIFLSEKATTRTRTNGHPCTRSKHGPA